MTAGQKNVRKNVFDGLPEETGNEYVGIDAMTVKIQRHFGAYPYFLIESNSGQYVL